MLFVVQFSSAVMLLLSLYSSAVIIVTALSSVTEGKDEMWSVAEILVVTRRP